MYLLSLELCEQSVLVCDNFMLGIHFGPSVAVLQTKNLATVRPKSEFLADLRLAGNVFVLIITILG